MFISQQELIQTFKFDQFIHFKKGKFWPEHNIRVYVSKNNTIAQKSLQYHLKKQQQLI